MELKEIILFDLDGTITNPKEGITKSIQYSLKHFDIEVENLDDLTKFIGPPLMDTYIKYYGLNDNDAKVAIEKYREYFAEYGIYENVVYDGMNELLAKLQNSGKRLIVATSKPAFYATKVLEYFNLDKYFEYVSGPDMNGKRSRKNEVIEYAIEQCKICNVDNAIMIGDREHDVLGAKEHKIECIGVTYGFGGFEELSNAGACHIVDSVETLSQLLMPS